MTTQRLAATKGRALMEYVVLIIIILTALYWMKGPIARAFYGRWKATGDSFAFGRQYDPKGTMACTRYKLSDQTWVWADERCFDGGRRVCDALRSASAVVACEDGLITQCAANCQEANDDPYYN